MKSFKLVLFAGGLALAAMAALAAVPPILSVGFALASVFALFAPEPVNLRQDTPRSIFETRRQGLL